MRLLVFTLNFLRPKNWPLLTYFTLNALLMLLIGYLITGYLNVVFVYFYLASLIFITLPFGENILRLKNKAIPIKKLGDRRIERIFDEVYTTAKNKSKFRLSRRVKLYFTINDKINACALGDRTIIINTGILGLSDNEIKAILYHEFSHLIEQDSFYNVAYNLGNLIIFVIFVIFKLIIFVLLYALFFTIQMIINAIAGIRFDFEELIKIIIELLDNIYNLWNMIGLVLCMWTMRNSEYKADKYVKDNGYGKYLADILMAGDTDIDAIGDLVFLTHPSGKKRVERLIA